MEYPEWISKAIIFLKNGHRFEAVSDRRIEARKFLYEKMSGNCSLEQLDEIINFFKSKYYPATKWYGLSRVARRELFVEKKGRCMYCNKMLTLGNFTVEHIIPRAVGGDSEEENIGIACFGCNQERAIELSATIAKIEGIELSPVCPQPENAIQSYTESSA